MPRQRILIIEDQPAIADLLTDSLIDDFECIVANRLSAALGIIRANNINLIFADLGLPDSDGFETLERILAAAGSIPVIIGSGSTNHHNAMRALAMGAVGYIPKPYDLNILAERLERAIVRGQYIAKLREKIRALEWRMFEYEKIEAELAKPRTWLDSNKAAVISAIGAALVTALGAVLTAWITGVFK